MQADQLAGCGIDRSDYVLAHVSTVVSLRRPGASLHPPLPWARITLEARLVPEEDVHGSII